MVDVQDSLTYPFESDEWLKTILIGGILSIFSFLLIPIILVYGYIIQVIKTRYEGQPAPPEFGDWGKLFTDGVQAVIIGFIYMLIPIIVGAVFTGGAMVALLTGSPEGMAAGFAGVMGGLFVSFALSLIFGYLAVAALLNFAHEGDFGAAFEFGTISDLITSSDYAMAWLAGVVVFIAVSIISGVLNLIPILGAIVSAFIFFYAQMVAAYLWAQGFTNAVSEPA